MSNREKVKIEIWSEHFLGTTARAEQLISIINQLDDGLWKPEKWGHFEPIREPYESGSAKDILAAVQQQRGRRIANDVYFQRQKPFGLMGWLVWRSRVPSLNSFWAELEAREFGGVDGPDRLKKMVTALVKWSNAAYATVRHTQQKHYRSVQKTPEERLSQLDWLTFFGEPYIDLFGGRERVLSAPFFEILEVSGGLLAAAAPRPDSPEMTDSDLLLVTLEDYLGKDAFAGQGYPDVPCRVPRFDLSETVAAERSEEGQHTTPPRIDEPLLVEDQKSKSPKAVVVLTPDQTPKKH